MAGPARAGMRVVCRGGLAVMLALACMAATRISRPPATKPPDGARAPAASRPAADQSPRVHALLLNGGAKPPLNFLSHLHHLEQMVAALKARGVPPERIHLFSADGSDQGADLATRDTLPEAFWLVDGLKVAEQLRPRTRITNTVWPDVTLHPARRKALESWFREAGQTLTPDDWLLLFVTDHGTANEKDLDNGAISLWEEKITVRELAALLRTLPPWVRTVMVMSQCYSGSFAAAMYDGSDPGGNICGFFSTARDLKAYGCYPEGRDRDQIGHAFQFIDALQSQGSLAEAHAEVLVTDDTPDVPLRTSDLYLGRLLEERAANEGVPADVFADRLLARAWRNRAAWEPEIRLLDRIGDAFGTFSPRSLAELESAGRELAPLAERMRTYADRRRTALDGVKGENLSRFLELRPEWEKRLDGAGRLDAAGRQATLAELLLLLETHARAGDGALWARLNSLKEKADGARDAAWRLEVRQSVTRRMRSILEGVAGRVLLETPPRALTDLMACESLAPGVPPRPQQAARVRRFPRLADEVRLLEKYLPSWLGVRFARDPEPDLPGRDLPAGATLLEAIFPDSPASAAGLAAGDYVLGPPGRIFSATQQLREWTMTSPTGMPLDLMVLRPGPTPKEDQQLRLQVTLRPYPEKWPELPGPPDPGEPAPALPPDLVPVSGDALPVLAGRSHVLFFWATWCGPCKAAVPEVMAFARARGIPVLAISDEEPAVVREFLERRTEPFFEHVAVDPHRTSMIRHGVSGTPTLVLVDEKGIIRHRQVGYRKSDGLMIEGWSWR